MSQNDPANQEIKAIAKEMWERIDSLREVGIDTWRIAPPTCWSQRNHLQQSSGAPPSSPPLTPPSRVETSMTLDEIRSELGDCRRCTLCAGRTNIVFGSGDPRASLLFVGEAPGADEDLQGEPFVGRAGQLLTKMIIAMGLERREVYIANIIKCRPPKNRNPEPDEIAACQPFLFKQIQAIRPRVICALGGFSAQTLLSTQRKISELRGTFHDLQALQGDDDLGIKVLPTFHPAYLLRNPSEKKRVWEDLQKIMEELKKDGGQSGDRR